jgi:hypothetical protein
MVESRALMVVEVLRHEHTLARNLAPGPLEDYAMCFDDLFRARA